MKLLYLATQIRFPIGGERVTCHGLKLTQSLGRVSAFIRGDIKRGAKIGGYGTIQNVWGS